MHRVRGAGARTCVWGWMGGRVGGAGMRARGRQPRAPMGQKSVHARQSTYAVQGAACCPCPSHARPLTGRYRCRAVGALGALVAVACIGGAFGYLAPPPSSLLTTRDRAGESRAPAGSGRPLPWRLADVFGLRACRAALHGRAMRAKRRPVAAAAVGGRG